MLNKVSKLWVRFPPSAFNNISGCTSKVDGVSWDHDVASSSLAIQTRVELILVIVGTTMKIEN